ncbi:hypothetical protein FB451DRAFT_1173333 [Mycena latifolia]|nr:hypothetical protein FB451DRAFT_1173333 [Mycena latifolia]
MDGRYLSIIAVTESQLSGHAIPRAINVIPTSPNLCDDTCLHLGSHQYISYIPRCQPGWDTDWYFFWSGRNHSRSPQYNRQTIIIGVDSGVDIFRFSINHFSRRGLPAPVIGRGGIASVCQQRPCPPEPSSFWGFQGPAGPKSWPLLGPAAGTHPTSSGHV